MNKHEDSVDVVELGVATIETQGSNVRSTEIGGMLPKISGISDDD